MSGQVTVWWVAIGYLDGIDLLLGKTGDACVDAPSGVAQLSFRIVIVRQWKAING